MSTIIFGSTVSLVTSATPSEGGYIIGYDIDGILKQKDSFGNITEIGGGPTAGSSGTASLLNVLSIGNTTGPYDIIFGTGSKISSINGSGEISLDEGSTGGLISISTDDGTDYSKIYVSPTFSQIRHSVGTTFSNLTIQKGDSILLTGDSDNFTTIRTSADIFKVEFTRPSLLSGQIKIVESGTTYDTGSLNKAFLHLNTFGSTTDAGVQNSVIIGGQGISASESDSVYVPQLVIQNSKLIKGSTGGGVVDLTNGDVVLTNSSSAATIGIFSPLSTSTWLSSSNGILVVDSSTGSTSPDVAGPNVFVSTRGSYLGPGVENSVIVGGIGLSGISSNTVYLGNSVNINGQFTLPSSDGTTGQILKTDGLGNVTWQDETVSSGTNSLDEILQEGNNTQVYDIIMGTGTGIRSSNTGGSIFLDSSGNPGEVVISTDNGNLLTAFLELSGDDILLNSSNGKLDINTFESNIISGDTTGLKYSFDYSATFVTYSLVSKNYVDSKDISTFSVVSGLTGSFSSGVLQISTEVDTDSIEINANNEISLKSTILGDRQFNGSVNILGNLAVLGTTSTINTENLLVRDNFITLNATYSGPSVIDSGIEVNVGNGTYSKFYWDASTSYWVLGASGSETEVITSAGTGLTKSNNQLLVDFSVVASNSSVYSATSSIWNAIDSISNNYISDIISGVGLTGGGTAGSVTLDVNVDNGLSISASNSVVLGGTLSQTTKISTDIYSFSMNTLNSTGIRFDNITTGNTHSVIIRSGGSYLSSLLTTGEMSSFQSSGDVLQMAITATDSSESSISLHSSGQSILDGSLDNRMIITDDSQKGLVYYDDYSGNFTTYSLVTKGYVDSLSSNSSLSQVLATGNTSSGYNILLTDSSYIEYNGSTYSSRIIIESDILTQNRSLVLPNATGPIPVIGGSTSSFGETGYFTKWNSNYIMSTMSLIYQQQESLYIGSTSSWLTNLFGFNVKTSISMNQLGQSNCGLSVDSTGGTVSNTGITILTLGETQSINFGLYNSVNTSNAEQTTGIYNLLGGTNSNNTTYGIRNIINMASCSTVYGIFHDIDAGTDTSVGSYTQIPYSSRFKYGYRSYLSGDSISQYNYGLYTDVSGATDSNIGLFSKVSGTFGTNYGVYIDSQTVGNIGLYVEGGNNISIMTTQGTAVFNENNSTTSDFIIKSNANNSLFHLSSNTNSIGIGTSSPNSDSILDIWSTDKAMMIPRLTATAASSLTPLEGMMCYVSTTNGTFTSRGFWGYIDSGWTKLS